jgi:hypothetical protein
MERIFCRRARDIGNVAAAGVSRLMLFCLLLAVYCVLSPFVAAPAAAADPFQRTITFRNDLPITVYPVVTAVENQNGASCGTQNVLRRIIVNFGKKGAGVPTGQKVQVSIPKSPSCWYSAVRVYVFSVDLTKYETLINPTEQTVPDNMKWNPPLCANSACWTGSATAQYDIDSPAQLVEYTVDSLDPATGIPFPDPNNPAGIPLVDLDLSFVDSVYLPVAMSLDDGGATQYMGTALPYGQFNQRTAGFLVLKDAMQRPLWSEFAAYSATNWPNNIFNDLGSNRTDQVEGGFNLVDNVLNASQSPLYTPTYSGPAACTNPANAICMKAGLVGNCCPAPSPTGPKFLNCCATQPYLIDNTTKINATVANPVGTASNPSVNSFVQGWTTWIAGNPCTNISTIGPWPSTLPAFNKQAFCNTFKATAQFVWQSFAPACAAQSGAAKNLCIVDKIIGYASTTDKGQLPESVQALQRSVPWGDPSKGQLQYSFDPFILFWAPYNSIFNLNPYTRFVHNPTDGLNAPGAYSFSIDDLFGNFQGRASGFFVEIGGNSALPNQDAYDPYEQYDVGFAGGWDHATVCSRAVPIPGAKPGNAPISFWLNGAKQTNCDIAFFTTPAGTQFAKYRVNQVSKTVTDTYTGLTQTVTQLTLDSNYCNTNSTPALVTAGVCVNSNVSPNVNGAVNYASLSNADKPNVHLNLPANPM